MFAFVVFCPSPFLASARSPGKLTSSSDIDPFPPPLPFPLFLSPSFSLSLSPFLSFFNLFLHVKFTLRRPCESRCAHKFLKRKRRPAANNTRLRNYCAARNALLIFYSSLPRLSPPPSAVREFLFIFSPPGRMRTSRISWLRISLAKEGRTFIKTLPPRVLL